MRFFRITVAVIYNLIVSLVQIQCDIQFLQALGLGYIFLLSREGCLYLKLGILQLYLGVLQLLMTFLLPLLKG